MKVVVDRDKCQGVGMCESIAADLFEVDDDARSRLVRDPTDDDAATVDEAVDSCPTGALSVGP